MTMSLNQLARSVGLSFADKFDGRSTERRNAQAERRADGKARAAADRARQRNKQKKPHDGVAFSEQSKG